MAIVKGKDICTIWTGEKGKDGQSVERFTGGRVE